MVAIIAMRVRDLELESRVRKGTKGKKLYLLDLLTRA